VNGVKLILPGYIKVTILLAGISALVAILYVAKSIVVPLVFAMIVAIVLHPLVSFLVRRKVNRLLAISIIMLITFFIIAGLGVVLISQASRLTESWPLLVERFTTLLNQTISDVAEYFKKDPQKIHDWIIKVQGELMSKSTAAIGQTLMLLGNGLVVLLLIPFYVFMLLFYQPLLLDFIRKASGSNYEARVSSIVTEIKTVIQRYLVGLVIEAGIMAVLNTATLLAMGIEYAFILGITAALLNVVPYIGGIIAVALPMIVAIVTKPSPWYAFFILLAYWFIQLIDNNIIVPYIVASKIKINALFAVLAVLVGNAFWGISGMFLSMPLIAIVKLICDHIDPLKPWGYLLGDTMPPILKIKKIFK